MTQPPSQPQLVPAAVIQQQTLQQICLSPAAPQGAFENVERFAAGNKNRDLRLPAAGCPLACKIRRLGCRSGKGLQASQRGGGR